MPTFRKWRAGLTASQREHLDAAALVLLVIPWIVLWSLS